jgi:hypothetical protein
MDALDRKNHFAAKHDTNAYRFHRLPPSLPARLRPSEQIVRFVELNLKKEIF